MVECEFLAGVGFVKKFCYWDGNLCRVSLDRDGFVHFRKKNSRFY